MALNWIESARALWPGRWVNVCTYIYNTGDRPGRSATTELERAVHTERGAVFHAAARGSTAGRRRTTRQPHGSRPSRRLHGPHPHLPGTGGKTQGAPRRLGRVQLSQGHRPLQLRCVTISYLYLYWFRVLHAWCTARRVLVCGYTIQMSSKI